MKIENFVEIVRQKNGSLKLLSSRHLQTNSYQLLHNLGFRVCKVAERRVYYRRVNEEVIPIRLSEIEAEFTKQIRTMYLDNLPEGVGYDQFMNWYYSAAPIKENSSLLATLRESLNQEELHIHLLQTDGNYKSDFELKILLTKFEEWGLSKVVDVINCTPKKNDRILHYKHLTDNKFIVFAQWNAHNKRNTGFDVGVATYKNEKDVGVKEPYTEQHIRSSFDLQRDYKLVSQYL
jgi:hypothetical protein